MPPEPVSAADPVKGAPRIVALRRARGKAGQAKPDRLPQLEKDVSERIKYLRGCVREIGRRYCEELEHDLAEVLEQARELVKQQAKAGPKASSLERLLDVIDGLRLKPEKGRRKDLRRIEQAVSQMEKALAKKK